MMIVRNFDLVRSKPVVMNVYKVLQTMFDLILL